MQVPGNHDLDPAEGGLASWRRILGSSGMGNHTFGAGTGNHSLGAGVGVGSPDTNYRAVRVARGWRLLLLDSMDGVAHDVDGHGHIGDAQLTWLDAQLHAAAAAAEQVLLMRMHVHSHSHMRMYLHMRAQMCMHMCMHTHR